MAVSYTHLDVYKRQSERAINSHPSGVPRKMRDMDQCSVSMSFVFSEVKGTAVFFSSMHKSLNLPVILIGRTRDQQQSGMTAG